MPAGKLEDKLKVNSDSTVISSTFATKTRLKLPNCFTFDFPEKYIATTEPPLPNLLDDRVQTIVLNPCPFSVTFSETFW